MIYYKSGGVNIFLKLFKCHGSNFPITILVALPSALLSAVVHMMFPNGNLRLVLFGEDSGGGIMTESQAWAGFSFLVGFLIVFRTSQAYGRFWEGCTASHTMRAEWFDACSSLVSFCKASCAPHAEVAHFKHLLIRLTSMLHAAALAELESGDVNSESSFSRDYDLIDPGAVDSRSIETLKISEARVELLFEWIQQLIVENIETGVLSIPPPILSRSFQELANGMVAFHDAMKISYIPFPFPYAQSCDCLLIFHWLLVPVVTSQWVSHAVWAAVFCFIQVFILWSLNLIAIEIDNPFGRDMNDIDASRMQKEINTHLTLLVMPSTERTPKLLRNGSWENSTNSNPHGMDHVKSFSELLSCDPDTYPFDKRNGARQSSLVAGMSRVGSAITAATSSGIASLVGDADIAKEAEVAEVLTQNAQPAARRESLDGDILDTTEDVVADPQNPQSRQSWIADNSSVGADPVGSVGSRGLSGFAMVEATAAGRKKTSSKAKPKMVHQCPLCFQTLGCGRAPNTEGLGDITCARCDARTSSMEHQCSHCQKSFCRMCVRGRSSVVREPMVSVTPTVIGTTPPRPAPAARATNGTRSPSAHGGGAREVEGGPFLRTTSLDSLDRIEGRSVERTQDQDDAESDLEVGVW
eukprot:CAMPEP_0178407026 /NCGR_PEP_ID=MMETSP0689_2-20121128/19216_1 /TAXON_ID=160604 /ORGANISM="Amphidinium massartii, Strain CS-259" /LENGTH=638 /DNA_ID=CAMNT_0020028087 /DNA_START=29 /DNA_END=1942 /DNA_ORIENTATION=+